MEIRPGIGARLEVDVLLTDGGHAQHRGVQIRGHLG